MPPHKNRSYQGVVLTTQGWNKFQSAKTQVEFEENEGDRFTQEELSERTGLSLTTISKVLRRSVPVDEQSLQQVFRAFGLELSKHDYTRSRSELEENPIQAEPSNWESPIDTSTFCGRNGELTRLKQWVSIAYLKLSRT